MEYFHFRAECNPHSKPSPSAARGSFSTQPPIKNIIVSVPPPPFWAFNKGSGAIKQGSKNEKNNFFCHDF
jgi:hypothetical protein